jgi:long-subunit fatty acid transport protein
LAEKDDAMKVLLAATGISLIWAATACGQPAGTQQTLAPNAAMHAIDIDQDGTISLDEAKKAAEAKFTALDTDHDGTVDVKELMGTLGAKAVRTADKDKDHTLDKTEYLAVVEARFKRADTDHDGTLNLKELRTSTGQALLKLLQ